MDRHRVGRVVRALRHRRGWTQAELGRRAGCSRSIVSRIETGARRLGSDARLSRVVEELGAQLVVSVHWRGGELDRLLDADHVALQSRWAAIRGARWVARQEVTYNHFGDRGAIDDLAVDPSTGVLLVTELKTGIYDAQRTAAKLDEKERLGTSLARRFGWNVRRVVACLVVADTRTNRRRVEAGSGVLERFSCRGVAAKRWLHDPREPVDGVLLFVALPHVRGTNVRQAGRQRVRQPQGAASGNRGSGTVVEASDGA